MIKIEDVVFNSQNLRLYFFWYKIFIIEDFKDNCGLFEVECLFLIEGNDFKDFIIYFSDSSLSVSDENICFEFLGFCGS